MDYIERSKDVLAWYIVALKENNNLIKIQHFAECVDSFTCSIGLETINPDSLFDLFIAEDQEVVNNIINNLNLHEKDN